MYVDENIFAGPKILKIYYNVPHKSLLYNQFKKKNTWTIKLSYFVAIISAILK